MKLPAPQLYFQQLVQVNNEENTPVTGGFPLQSANNAQSIVMSRRLHGDNIGGSNRISWTQWRTTINVNV